MHETKIWKVVDNELQELKAGALDFENRIHAWIERDINLLLPDALLIGSKVKTDNGEIDLLAIDSSGDLIVIELKRDSTTRDVIGQILDYAAWASTLTPESLTILIQKSGRSEDIYELLNRAYYNEDIKINGNQKLLIVASKIDSITTRIIEYLSNSGININAATFNYYKENDNEFIARNFLITSEEIYTKDKNKKSGRFITGLFNEGKLKIDQQVIYLPLRDTSIAHTAKIFRIGSNCLQIPGSDEKFSFSKLRAKYILENQLPYNAYFPYNQWEEWAVLDDSSEGFKKLSEL